MTASELLSDLRRRGVKLWLDNGELRFGAPKGTLGPDFAGLLLQHKPELIELLQFASAADAPAARPRGQGRASSLDRRIIALSSLSDWHIEEQVPYVCHVAPYRGFLYQNLGLERTYVRGEGCYLIDEEGTRYADFVAQFGAVPFGHDPEPIWDALERARREGRPNLAIASVSPVAGELAERLLALAPPGFAHVVFTNSGAESVEVAIKLARCRTGRLGILSSRNGFHGLTLAGMSATDNDFFQRGFGAPVPGFNYVPFGDLAALEAALEMRPGYFAAFMVEPIQGESGINVAPPGYLAAARDLCRRFGALLIIDEVQTGLGRTGRLFACEEEGVTPDILLLAKALGGGLVPVGACLYTRDVFTEEFDLRHGSTFAGNTLACTAGLATLDELTKNDRQLVRHVARMGEHLQAQLQALQREFPSLVGDIRGRGLMLGVELNLEHIARTQTGLLAMLQEQNLLLVLIVSYLLNVEHIRIAASFTQGTVLRIEPPLVADAALCDRLIAALRRTLRVLETADAGELLRHLIGGETPLARVEGERPRAVRAATAQSLTGKAGARFAFVVHLLGNGDLRRLDPALDAFDDEHLERLRARLSTLARPFAHGRLAVRSADGRLSEGELIVLPHLPSELLALPGAEARDLVQEAVDLASERGAGVVGLGGFSSIVAAGGLAVRPPPGIRVTSGNNLTTWAALRAVEDACAAQGVDLAQSTVSIVGATGAIGHALSLLFAERAGKLILIGNPNAAEASLGKLGDVAKECERHQAGLANGGATGSVISVTTDIDSALPQAQVILTATNAVAPFISARHLRDGAIVCDVSRPFNVMPGLAAARPDVRLLSGGLVRAPEPAILGQLEDAERAHALVACAAETIVLALSGYRAANLCGRLDVATITELGRLATELGFSLAD